MIFELYRKGNLCNAAVFINGKPAEFKTEPVTRESGAPSNSVARTEVDGDVELELFYRSPLTFKNWFAYAFIYWICGIFGLFSPRYRKPHYVLEYRAKMNVTADSRFVITVQTPRNGRAVYLESPVPYEESGFSWQPDKIAKKRKKKIVLITWIFWLAAVGVSAYFIVKTILGF